MIEILQGYPDSVVAFAAKGHVTQRDYVDVLIPKVEQALKRYGKIRCYYELGADFSGIEAGAAWEDFVLGIEHLRQWDRVAVVTDVEWMRHAVNVFRFLVSGEIRVFGVSQATEAQGWICATSGSPR